MASRDQPCADGALPVLTAGAMLDSFSVRDGAVSWIFENEQYHFRMGAIATVHGVVAVYDQGRLGGALEATQLDFAVNGRCYRASWSRTFSERFLKTLATRFAAYTLATADGVGRAPRPTGQRREDQ